MKITEKIIRVSFYLAIILFSTIMAKGQEIENEFQTRTSVELGFSPLKKIKVNLTPELRFDENFSLDNYLVEGEIVYKPNKLVSFDATYRFIANPKESETTEYNNRYTLGATLKKEIYRFQPSLKIAYSNYADDEIDDKKYMRYKASVKYDIQNCKFTPFISAELFQQTIENNLHKTRHTAGFSYKLMKNNSINLCYKFDYYNNEYKNKHIFSVGYKLKF